MAAAATNLGAPTSPAHFLSSSSLGDLHFTTYREPRKGPMTARARLAEVDRGGVKVIATVPTFKGAYGGAFDPYGETGVAGAVNIQNRSTGVEYPVDGVCEPNDPERSHHRMIVAPIADYIEAEEHYGVYAVGAGGSGKTHALFGSGEGGVGVAFEMLKGLMTRLQVLLGEMKSAGAAGATVLLTVSMFELHADGRVVDLANLRNTEARIREGDDAHKDRTQLYIDHITEVVLEDEVDGVDFILEGLQHRTPPTASSRPSTVLRFRAKVGDGEGPAPAVSLVDVIEVNAADEPVLAGVLKQLCEGSFALPAFASPILRLALPKLLLSGLDGIVTLMPCVSTKGSDKAAATATLKLMRDAYELRVTPPEPGSTKTAPADPKPLCCAFSFARAESHGDFTLTPNGSEMHLPDVITATPISALLRPQHQDPMTPEAPGQHALPAAQYATSPGISVLSGDSNRMQATPLKHIQALQAGIRKVAEDLRMETARRVAVEQKLEQEIALATTPKLQHLTSGGVLSSSSRGAAGHVAPPELVLTGSSDARRAPVSPESAAREDFEALRNQHSDTTAALLRVMSEKALLQRELEELKSSLSTPPPAGLRLSSSPRLWTPDATIPPPPPEDVPAINFVGGTSAAAAAAVPAEAATEREHKEKRPAAAGAGSLVSPRKGAGSPRGEGDAGAGAGVAATASASRLGGKKSSHPGKGMSKRHSRLGAPTPRVPATEVHATPDRVGSSVGLGRKKPSRSPDRATAAAPTASVDDAHHHEAQKSPRQQAPQPTGSRKRHTAPHKRATSPHRKMPAAETKTTASVKKNKPPTRNPGKSPRPDAPAVKIADIQTTAAAAAASAVAQITGVSSPRTPKAPSSPVRRQLSTPGPSSPASTCRASYAGSSVVTTPVARHTRAKALAAGAGSTANNRVPSASEPHHLSAPGAARRRSSTGKQAVPRRSVSPASPPGAGGKQLSSARNRLPERGGVLSPRAHGTHGVSPAVSTRRAKPAATGTHPRSTSPNTARPTVTATRTADVVLDLKKLDRPTRRQMVPTKAKTRRDHTPRVHRAPKSPRRTPRAEGAAERELWMDF